MTMTDCASCADERAAGAAFCEACGRALGAPCPNCGIPGGVGEDGYCQNCGMLAGRPRDHIENDCGEVRERDIRFALESAYREMARAAHGPERIRLVDLANESRPRTRT